MKNRKLLIILFSALLFSLSGCKNDRVKISKNNSGTDLYEFTVDGTSLECISIGSGKSCNWEKYNQLKKVDLALTCE